MSAIYTGWCIDVLPRWAWSAASLSSAASTHPPPPAACSRSLSAPPSASGSRRSRLPPPPVCARSGLRRVWDRGAVELTQRYRRRRRWAGGRRFRGSCCRARSVSVSRIRPAEGGEDRIPNPVGLFSWLRRRPRLSFRGLWWESEPRLRLRRRVSASLRALFRFNQHALRGVWLFALSSGDLAGRFVLQENGTSLWEGGISDELHAWVACDSRNLLCFFWRTRRDLASLLLVSVLLLCCSVQGLHASCSLLSSFINPVTQEASSLRWSLSPYTSNLFDLCGLLLDKFRITDRVCVGFIYGFLVHFAGSQLSFLDRLPGSHWKRGFLLHPPLIEISFLQLPFIICFNISFHSSVPKYLDSVWSHTHACSWNLLCSR